MLLEIVDAVHDLSQRTRLPRDLVYCHVAITIVTAAPAHSIHGRLGKQHKRVMVAAVVGEVSHSLLHIFEHLCPLRVGFEVQTVRHLESQQVSIEVDTLFHVGNVEPKMA